MVPLEGTRFVNRLGSPNDRGSSIRTSSFPQTISQLPAPRISGLATDNHRVVVEGELVYVADGVTEIIEFEGTLDSPYVGNKVGEGALSIQHLNNRVFPTQTAPKPKVHPPKPVKPPKPEANYQKPEKPPKGGYPVPTSTGGESGHERPPPPESKPDPPSDRPPIHLSPPPLLPNPPPTHSASPLPPIPKPVPAPPAPVQTQPSPVSNPINVPGALATQTGLTPRPTTIGTALGDQDPNPTPTDPSLPTPSQGTVRDVGKFTSVEVTTTLVTEGVYTTSFTTNLPDDKTSVVVRTTTGLHTITTTTEVPTQISTTSSKTGPPVGTIGGVSGATVIATLALVAFYVLRHKRRRQNKYFQADTGVPSPPANAVVEASVIPHPFLGTLSPREQPAGQGGKNQLESPHSAPHHNQPSDRGGTVTDPFQDPEAVQDQVESVPRTRNVLDRLQELTREVEEELRELGDRTRSGQLSDSERERLDEIRRTTGLTIVYDRRRGRFSATSSASSYGTSPPSHHSGYD